MASFDPNSKTSKSRIEETFTVTFAYACAEDEVCIVQSDGTTCITSSDSQSAADASADLVYVAGDALVTIPKSGKQTTSGCPLTVTYEYFKDDIQSWTGFSSIQNTAIQEHADGDGQVNVEVVAADVDNFCPHKKFKIRVTYTST
jgi:hypothetical protein